MWLCVAICLGSRLARVHTVQTVQTVQTPSALILCAGDGVSVAQPLASRSLS